jgi:hypothetical protein
VLPRPILVKIRDQKSDRPGAVHDQAARNLAWPVVHPAGNFENSLSGLRPNISISIQGPGDRRDGNPRCLGYIPNRHGHTITACEQLCGVETVSSRDSVKRFYSKTFSFTITSFA